MRKNLFKSLLLTILVSVVGMGNVLAANPVTVTYREEQSTNVNDYKVNFAIVDKGKASSYGIAEIFGLRTTAENVDDYLIKFVDKGTTIPTEVKRSDLSDNDNYHIGLINLTEDGKYVSSFIDQLYLEDNDLDAYIYNCTGVESGNTYPTMCKLVINNPIQVTKEAMPGLTERYQTFLFTKDGQNTLDVFALFPNTIFRTVEAPKSNIKIGLIEDESVIRSLAKNEPDAVNKLYNYAKNATNFSVFSNKFGDYKAVDTSSIAVEDGRYYYIYIDIEDPDNKYIDVSDVSIAMGKAGMIVNEVDYGKYSDDLNFVNPNYEYACYSCSNDYVWTAKGYQAKTCKLVDSITDKANCVKNAKTGVEDYLIPGTLTLVVGGTILALVSKKSKFKRI